jgi:hypothetical protein
MLPPTHLVTGQTAFLLAAALPDLDSWRSYTGRLPPFIYYKGLPWKG